MNIRRGGAKESLRLNSAGYREGGRYFTRFYRKFEMRGACKGLIMPAQRKFNAHSPKLQVHTADKLRLKEKPHPKKGSKQIFLTACL